MLEVFYDPHGIVGNPDLIIEEPKHFVGNWEKIISWAENGHGVVVLKICVAQEWFKNLKDVFGNAIIIKESSPRKHWENQFQIALPNEIRDEDIAFLLKQNLNPSAIADKLLGTLFLLMGFRELSEHHMEEFLLESILKGAEEKFPQTLSITLKNFVSSQPKGKRECWQFILDASDKKATVQHMIKNFVVKTYPVTSEIYQQYRKESFDFASFDVPAKMASDLPEDFKEVVRSYLRNFVEKRDNTFFNFISGKMIEELEVVLQFLRDNPLQEKEIIQDLMRKSIEIPETSREIRKYFPAESPDPSNLTKDKLSSWLEQYFDYYNFSRWIGHYELTASLIKDFENFVMSQYGGKKDWLLSHSVLTVNSIIKDFLKKGFRVLLVVVDGLSYLYYKELRQIFSEGEIKPLFSTLPTRTPENKQRMLSGLLDTNASYTNRLKDYFKDLHWEESGSNKESLSEFLKKDLELYIYWENQFDVLIHQPMSVIKRHHDHLALIRQIRSELNDFTKSGGKAIITGDHGFTILPEDKINKISLPDSINVIHNRLAYAEDLIESPENIYRIGTYLIPKGYGYFNSLPRGGTHGGISPEELLVPLIIPAEEIKEIVPLIFSLKEKQYRRKIKHETLLEIKNTNPFGVLLEDLKLLPAILKIQDQLPFIPAKGQISVSVQLDLTTVSQDKVTLLIAYRAKGKEFQEKLEIRTTGAMIESADDWN